MVVSRLLQSALIGPSGIDFLSLIATASVIGIVAMLATSVPALRTMRAEPAAALRAD
jgi:ABC-type lipoprotein release transport system permease subunit